MSISDPTEPPLVSVIIPAYNAEATLAETLASVCAQTYRNLEIIVVDDGSRDMTHALAERAAQGDPRIRALRQDNAGVAAARNHGIREARGDFVAFVDADDIWLPEKTRMQMDALLAGGDRAGLAYCWSARIDADSLVFADWDRPQVAGAVLDELFRGNFVGNGSSALVRKHLAEAVGGFEPRLHNQGAQGCEDILFYLRVASLAEFVVIEQHLVGYRQLEGAMSDNPQRMWRSWLLMTEEMEGLHPNHLHPIRSGLANYGFYLFERLLRQRRFGEARELLGSMLAERPWLWSRLVACAAGALVWRAKFRINHALRYRIKLLPPHKGGLSQRLFGRRFRSRRAPS